MKRLALTYRDSRGRLQRLPSSPPRLVMLRAKPSAPPRWGGTLREQVEQRFREAKRGET